MLASCLYIHSTGNEGIVIKSCMDFGLVKDPDNIDSSAGFLNNPIHSALATSTICLH